MALFPFELVLKQFSFHPYSFLFVSQFSCGFVLPNLPLYKPCYTPSSVSLQDKAVDERPVQEKLLSCLMDRSSTYATSRLFTSPYGRTAHYPLILRLLIKCIPYVNLNNSHSINVTRRCIVGLFVSQLDTLLFSAKVASLATAPAFPNFLSQVPLSTLEFCQDNF